MTNNKLKIIAIISMIIDHIGYYFSKELGIEVYIACRIIGRVAMPIFTFLIIEGYFHTSNFKKYITRLLSIATITQIGFFILDYIAGENSYNLFNTANIVFSFVLTLIVIKCYENIVKNKVFKNKLVLVITLAITIILYKLISFDYGIMIILLGVVLYIFKKYIKNKMVYNVLTSLSIIVISIINGINNNFHFFAMISLIPILLYNGKLGKKNNILKWIFYLIFPLQHILLYIISIGI